MLKINAYQGQGFYIRIHSQELSVKFDLPWNFGSNPQSTVWVHSNVTKSPHWWKLTLVKFKIGKLNTPTNLHSFSKYYVNVHPYINGLDSISVRAIHLQLLWFIVKENVPI